MSSCIVPLKTDLNDARRKCDSLEAQLAQLREMAKQKSGQQLEQVLFLRLSTTFYGSNF